MKWEKGFTVIELLVVIGIISVVAAIAIPQFSDYRRQSFNTRALTDVRNLINSQEAFNAENETYFSCASNTISGGAVPACEGNMPGLEKLSDGVLLVTMSVNQEYVIAACHMKGTAYFFFETHDLSVTTSAPSIIEKLIAPGTCPAEISTFGDGSLA